MYSKILLLTQFIVCSKNMRFYNTNNIVSHLKKYRNNRNMIKKYKILYF